jgi:hypothetical protein
MAPGELALESKHWFALGGALKTTQLALLIACLGCGVVGLGMIADALRTNPALGDWLTTRTISLLNLWGSAGIVLGWGMLLSGWFACCAAWPLPDRKFLQMASAAAAVSAVLVLIVLSLQVFGIIGDSMAPAPTSNVGTMSTAMIVIGSLGCAASLIPFSYFLSGLQQQMGRDHLIVPPMIYATIAGVLTLWCVISRLFVEPNTALKAWLVVLSTLIAFIAELLWLWLLNASARRDLRVSQAWKRLE